MFLSHEISSTNDNLHSEDNNASEDPIELAKGGRNSECCRKVKSISGEMKDSVHRLLESDQI